MRLGVQTQNYELELATADKLVPKEPKDNILIKSFEHIPRGDFPHAEKPHLAQHGNLNISEKKQNLYKKIERLKFDMNLKSQLKAENQSLKEMQKLLMKRLEQ